MSDEPAWLALARRELGVTEVPGPSDNARILGFFRDVGHGEVRHDEVAWCAAFVGACLERSGTRSTRSLMARSYLSWGHALAQPQPGCIVVLKRGLDPRFGHVGFYLGHAGGTVQLLGGNQANSVRIAAYPQSRVLSYRWPEQLATDTPQSQVFTTALQHVLAMEGGWSNDPADPGGATNFGITIGDYARHKGVRLTPASAPGLIAELRVVSPDTVRKIYRDDYWLKARCDLLPGAPAVMHFDAAVNHGVGRAARMLQEAARVPIDGAIGPITLAAVRDANPLALIARYADIRRTAYRRLSIFSRFGRGWLRRVDATLAAAKSMASVTVTWPEASSTQKESSMHNSDPKWWVQSLTIWGTLITALSTVLPIIGPFIGLDLSGALILNFGDQVTHILQAFGGVAGTLMAILGRFRAMAPLQQSLITLRL